MPSTIGGTSASAPVFASILTRINEERLAANKPPVGFVNPVLYDHPEVFQDITVGNNSGCGTPGFYAAEGLLFYIREGKKKKKLTYCLNLRLGPCHWVGDTNLSKTLGSIFESLR